MCGLAGIFAYNPSAPPVSEVELIAMRERMAARGPDGRGLWIAPNGRIGLAHRRLSIIDPHPRSTQPMATGDGRYRIIYNGEIYNYVELGREIASQGWGFRTTCDTEVLLALYARRGPAMIQALRGMFAFAIWDAKAAEVFLGRDRYGIKPLYYSDDGWTVRFASQVKALLAGGVSRERDPAGLAGFCLLGSVPEPFTTYRSIRALGAGETLVIDGLGARMPRRYWSLAQTLADAPPARITQTVRSEAAADALRDSVGAHQVADVPVGAFLSAGIDSGAILGLMCEREGEVCAVTLGFEEFGGRPVDETRLAAEVARYYGASHLTRHVDQAEFSADLPALHDAMDQPSIDGVNTWFVSKAAKEAGLKVALSGLGGDELFGGYRSFQSIPRLVAACRLPSRIPGLGRAARLSLAPLLQTTGLAAPKAAALLECAGTYPGAWFVRRGLFMPWELPALLGADIAREGLRRLNSFDRLAAAIDPDPGTGFGRVCALESCCYLRNQLLRDADWAGMAHSIEIRTPLVDHLLVARLAPLLRGTRPPQKNLLAAAPTAALPVWISERKKTGFGLPMGRWLDAARPDDDPTVPPKRETRGAVSRRWARILLATELAGRVSNGKSVA